MNDFSSILGRCNFHHIKRGMSHEEGTTEDKFQKGEAHKITPTSSHHPLTGATLPSYRQRSPPQIHEYIPPL